MSQEEEMSRNIFISHAVKDKTLVEKFVDDILQVGMDISANDIFCSSLSGMGIPSGKNFIDYIKEQIQQPKVVIVFFSKAYISSQFCMCELGATWAMTHNILPILVPPLTHSDIKGVLTGIQVDRVNSADELNRFQEEISHILGNKVSFSRWERKRDQFLKGSKEILESIMAECEIEKDSDYLELEKKYADAQAEIEEFEKKITSKDGLIDRLKRCKNDDEVDSIINSTFSNEEELFNNLTNEINKVFNKLPKIVIYVIYKGKILNNEVSFNSYEQDYLINYAMDASENEYLKYDEPNFYINEEDPTIGEALESIDNLEKFLNEGISVDLYDKLYKENGYRPSLGNKRFWKEYFYNSSLL